MDCRGNKANGQGLGIHLRSNVSFPAAPMGSAIISLTIKIDNVILPAGLCEHPDTTLSILLLNR